MKKIITKTIVALLFCTYAFVFGQSDFTTFSDPKKQLEFERKRIYINEEKGSVPLTFGGGSKTELANPLYPITGRDPQYVSKQSPIFTSVKYYHNFSMERNGVGISELDLLFLLGLEEEANEIIEKHRSSLKNWQQNQNEYEKGDKYRIEYYDVSPLTTITGDEITTEFFCYYPLLIMGCFSSLLALDVLSTGEGNIPNIIITLGLFFGIPYYDSKVTVKKEKKIKKMPLHAPQPRIQQTLSNNQIKGLVNTYNRNLYNKISESK